MGEDKNRHRFHTSEYPVSQAKTPRAQLGGQPPHPADRLAGGGHRGWVGAIALIQEMAMAEPRIKEIEREAAGELERFGKLFCGMSLAPGRA